MLAELLLHSIKKQVTPPVGFSSKRCLRYRLNSHDCNICLNLCRPRALALSGRKILFSEDRCTGCMVCVAACPNDAFGGNVDIQTFIQALRPAENGPVVLSCDRTHGHGDQYAIPCLGLFSEQALAVLHCLTPHELHLDTHRCGDCPNGHVVNLLDERIQAIGNKLGHPSSLKLCNYAGKDPVETDIGRQRRFLLSRAKDSLFGFVGSGISSVVDHADNPGEQAREEGKRSNRVSRLLLQTFEQLPPDADREKDLLRAYFYSVTAGANCDLCPICTGMCPTGALQRRTGLEGKQLVFTSAGCSGCGLCVAFCRKKALTLRQGGATGPDYPALAIAIA